MDFSVVSPDSFLTDLPPRPPSRTDSEASSVGRQRLHITAGGKEGKVLRKQLAIALGLRPKSSSASTSQSEGEESSYNLVEMMRRRQRSSSGKMQLPNLDNIVKNSRTTSRIVTRRTTTTTRSSLQDSEEEEFETEDAGRTGQKLYNKNGSTVESKKTLTSMNSSHVKKKESVGGNKKSEEFEEIFSSYGESGESAVVAPAPSAGAAVKHLRGKFPVRTRGKTNTKTTLQNDIDKTQKKEEIGISNRLSFSKGTNENVSNASRESEDLITVSTVIGVENEYEDWNSLDKEERNVGSSGSSEIQQDSSKSGQITGNTTTSRIPRLAKDKKTQMRLRNILSSVGSSDTGARYQSNLNLRTNMNSTELLMKSKESAITINLSHSEKDFDYDSLELELARLRQSMHRTLEDFRDMKEDTYRLKHEIRHIRDM